MISKIPEEKISEIEFYKKHWSWMTDEQWECVKLLCLLFRGFHHMTGKPKPIYRSGVEYNFRCSDLSTYDYDYLTRTVLLAHKYCIRASINPSGPNMLKMCLWKRASKSMKDAKISKRHPDLNHLIERARILNENDS